MLNVRVVVLLLLLPLCGFQAAAGPPLQDVLDAFKSSASQVQVVVVCVLARLYPACLHSPRSLPFISSFGWIILHAPSLKRQHMAHSFGAVLFPLLQEASNWPVLPLDGGQSGTSIDGRNQLFLNTTFVSPFLPHSPLLLFPLMDGLLGGRAHTSSSLRYTGGSIEPLPSSLQVQGSYVTATAADLFLLVVDSASMASLSSKHDHFRGGSVRRLPHRDFPSSFDSPTLHVWAARGSCSPVGLVGAAVLCVRTRNQRGFAHCVPPLSTLYVPHALTWAADAQVLIVPGGIRTWEVFQATGTSSPGLPTTMEAVEVVDGLNLSPRVYLLFLSLGS